MAVALRLYEQLTAAQDDKTRARLIAEAFEEMENRYPQIKDRGGSGKSDSSLSGSLVRHEALRC
jgi:hypothetical protein